MHYKKDRQMTHNTCIFCKIIARQMESDIIMETDDIIVIKDIYPKASVHYLIIPKKHIHDIRHLTKEDDHIAAALVTTAQHLSSSLLNSSDFRLVSNNGPLAGQVIFHIHFHFLAGTYYADSL
jgi:histidine triad (HIT) family protein